MVSRKSVSFFVSVHHFSDKPLNTIQSALIYTLFWCLRINGVIPQLKLRGLRPLLVIHLRLLRCSLPFDREERRGCCNCILQSTLFSDLARGWSWQSRIQQSLQHIALICTCIVGGPSGGSFQSLNMSALVPSLRSPADIIPCVSESTVQTFRGAGDMVMGRNISSCEVNLMGSGAIGYPLPSLQVPFAHLLSWRPLDCGGPSTPHGKGLLFQAS